jgi:RNA recognition motif-containing protein
LPYQAGWQDLKDLFRSAGNIVRADINIGIDGRAKGSGTVVFETAKDAQSAICKLPVLFEFFQFTNVAHSNVSRL